MKENQNYINIKELREKAPTIASGVDNICNLIYREGTITFDMEFALEQNICVFIIIYDDYVYILVKENGKWQYIEYIN